ncbi:SPOR domain-containing protein [Roseimarinus sediminis]|jgi:cell division protein FtsN|uniref:SPOR domain-containing protein n=1 Tax=Roseimarinus sediminis TaxID=1610899 RepID=UPI003D1CEFF3
MFKLNILQVLNTFFTAIVLISLPILSTAQSEEARARDYFEQGDFGKALPFFQQEYTLYPSDASAQYHYGICLSETGQYGSKARKLLLGAAQDANTPHDVYFYIAKNYHAAENFELALNYYQRFRDKAKKKERRGVEFDHFYDACREGINPFTANVVEETAQQDENILIESEIQLLSESSDTVKAKPETFSDSTDSHISEEASEAPVNNNRVVETDEWPVVPAVLADTSFNFTLAPKITYQIISQFKTAKGQHHFIEGWMNREKLAANMRTLESFRKQYQRTDNQEEQEKIAKELIALEQENFELKPLADEHHWQAREAELLFWNTASDVALKALKAENDSINNSKHQQLVVQPVEIEPVIPAETIPADTTVSEVIAEDKPVVAEEEKNELIYRIQIGAFSKGLPEYIDRLYKKLAVLRRIDSYTDERGVVVYTVGELRNFDDAVKLQQQIRQEGVKDAFVVAYHNGKRITLKEAREITKND